MDSASLSKQEEESRGIQTTQSSNTGDTATISITGSPDNDGITIVCIAIMTGGINGIEQQQLSSIYSAFDVPTVEGQAVQFIDSLMTCTWTAPWCVPEYHHYRVVVYNETTEPITSDISDTEYSNECAVVLY